MTTQLSTEDFCEKYEHLVKGCLQNWCKRSESAFHHQDQLYSEGMLLLVILSKSQTSMNNEEGYIANAIRNKFRDYMRHYANAVAVTRGVEHDMINVISIDENHGNLRCDDFFSAIDSRDEVLNGCCRNKEEHDVMEMTLDGYSMEEISSDMNITRTRIYKIKSAIRQNFNTRMERDII